MRRADAAEIFEHIINISNKLGALAYEAKTAGAGGGISQSRHCEDFAILLEGMACGNQGAAPVVRFDDNHAKRQSTDKSIACREHAGLRFHLHWCFGDERAKWHDVVGELFMLWWIDFGESAGEHSDRPAACVEGRTMGDAIDTARQAADNRESGTGQAGR